jgi:hypothetical protein
MLDGKACGKQAAQYTGKQPEDGDAVISRDMAAAENEVHSSGHTHKKACCSVEEDAHHESSCATSAARR